MAKEALAGLSPTVIFSLQVSTSGNQRADILLQEVWPMGGGGGVDTHQYAQSCNTDGPSCSHMCFVGLQALSVFEGLHPQ